MTLIEAIREAVQAAFKSAMLPDVVYATYSGGGLIVDSTLRVIPAENVDIPPICTERGLTVQCQSAPGSEVKINGELVLKAPLADGDTVAAVMHHDRQRFSVLYKI